MRKQFITTVFAVCISFSLFAAAIPKNDYIVRFSEIAIREKNQYNIPASVSMAQGILESSWGEGRLALQNNHFGIKCHSNWDGSTFSAIDDDTDKEGNLIESCFRAYETADESWRDHSDFLQQPRYQSLYDFGLDYRAWAVGLQTAGYATDPEYASKLISIIERYELYKLDGLAAPIVAPVVPNSEEGAYMPIEQKKPAVKKVKQNEASNDGTLFEMTPANETPFDEKIIEEEKTKPAAEKIPLEYLRGQGRKILDGLFNNLKKLDAKKQKSSTKDNDELDEIVPSTIEQKQKSSNLTLKGAILSEKVVVMR